MLAVLSQRYLLAIQGMKGTTNPDIWPCCVLLHTCPSHIPPSKNRWRIFIMPIRDIDLAPQQDLQVVGTDIIKFQ